MALGIINAAFSVSIDNLALFSRTLLPIIADKGCRFLFQLVASTDSDGHNSDQSLVILERSLRLIGILFGEKTMRQNLKLQEELFLSFTLDRLAPPPPLSNGGAPEVRLTVRGEISQTATRNATSSHGGFESPDPSARSFARTGADAREDSVSLGEGEQEEESDEFHLPPRLAILPARGETRELLLTSLTHLVTSQPSFIPDLWANYDCDLNCEDIFDKLVRFLTAVRYYPSDLIMGTDDPCYRMSTPSNLRPPRSSTHPNCRAWTCSCQ
jgi:brefeldin A-resistance guanine nucleotide exchange factor 1